MESAALGLMELAFTALEVQGEGTEADFLKRYSHSGSKGCDDQLDVGFDEGLAEIWRRRDIAHQNVDGVERGDLGECVNAEFRTIGDDNRPAGAPDHLPQHRSFFQ